MTLDRKPLVKFKPQHLLVLVVTLILCMGARFTYPKQKSPKGKKEVVVNSIKLKPGQLAAFAGKYRNMDNYVTITPANGGLILKQLQGKRATIKFYAIYLRQFNTDYFGKPYQIMFSGKGKAPSFVTDELDIWVRVK